MIGWAGGINNSAGKFAYRSEPYTLRNNDRPIHTVPICVCVGGGGGSVCGCGSKNLEGILYLS